MGELDDLITIRVPSYLKRELQEWAEKMKISLSQICFRAVVAGIDSVCGNPSENEPLKVEQEPETKESRSVRKREWEPITQEFIDELRTLAESRGINFYKRLRKVEKFYEHHPDLVRKRVVYQTLFFGRDNIVKNLL